MYYLKLQNAGSLDRRYLFLLGGGNKRGRADDLYTIGEKGSGLKLAIIGALKLGLKIIITSTDEIGQYVMAPMIKQQEIENKTYHQIWYEYFSKIPILSKSQSKEKKAQNLVETPFTLESFRDWTEPIGADDKNIFKVAREFIANAYDEDKNLQISYIQPSELVEAQKYETIIYLEAAKELMDLLSPERVYRYFKFFKGCPAPRHSYDGVGFIYPKSDKNITRLFVRGVLAGALADREYSSCFDYSLFSQTLLSEERIIKYMEVYRYYIAALLQSITDPNLAATVMAEIALGRAQFENYSFLWTELTADPPAATRVAYLTAWVYLSGPQAILPVKDTELNHRAEQTGYKIKNWEISNSLYEFLRACGVKTSADVVPLQGQMNFVPAEETELCSEHLANYLKARELLYRYFPGAKNVPLRLVKPKPGHLGKLPCGFAGELENNLKEICLNIKYFDSLEVVLTTMVHEYRHCASQSTDYTRKFIDAADRQIVQLIFKNEIERNRHVKLKSP